MYQESNAVAHLSDRGMRGEIPDRCGKDVRSCLKERRDVVRFISPMRQIATAGAAADWLAVHVENELIVRTHVHKECLWRLRKIYPLSKLQNCFSPFRDMRGANPLCSPRLRWGTAGRLSKRRAN